MVLFQGKTNQLSDVITLLKVFKLNGVIIQMNQIYFTLPQKSMMTQINSMESSWKLWILSFRY
jgi:hypothetical protein